MRIKTRLALTSSSSLAMIVVMILTLGFSSLATRRANAGLALANAMRATLLEQAILRDDYLNRQEGRAREQLAGKTLVLEAQLAEARRAFHDSEDIGILAEMTREARSKAAINERLVSLIEASAGGARGVAADYQKMLVGQLLIKSYLLNDYTSRLIDRRLGFLVGVKSLCDLLLALSLSVFAGLVIFNAVSIDRILSKGLRKLLAGARSIGEGDLGYRLAVDSDDEVADLAIEINRMASALMGSFTSITGLEDRISRRTAELDASNTELQAFAYSVAHDLRSPLRAIEGFSRLLEEELGPGASAEEARLLAVIRDNAVTMDSLITNLLEVSKVGHTELSSTSIDMKAMASGVFHSLVDPASGFLFELGDMPDAEADPVMMERVWANLLGNALKYSMPSPTHRIEVGGAEEAGMKVYFVKDRGVGFDPLYSDKLFGLFQRLHDQKEFPGNGVGLAIVRRVVAKHGGTVWAESRPGHGASFYFSLPSRS